MRLQRRPEVARPRPGHGRLQRESLQLEATNTQCSTPDFRITEVPVLFGFFNFSAGNKAGHHEGPVEAEVNVLDGCVDGQMTISFRFILQHIAEGGRVHIPSVNPFVAAHVELRKPEPRQEQLAPPEQRPAPAELRKPTGCNRPTNETK